MIKQIDYNNKSREDHAYWNWKQEYQVAFINPAIEVHVDRGRKESSWVMDIEIGGLYNVDD